MDSRPWHFVVAVVAGWLCREQQAVIDYLQEERWVLRELAGSKRLRFTDAQRRRLARKAKTIGLRGLQVLSCIVTPETLLRWYRQLVARKYDGSQRRRIGRPRKPEELRDLVVTLARENRTWGYTRLRDVLRSLGHDIGRTTIQELLKEQGLDPIGEPLRPATSSPSRCSPCVDWSATTSSSSLTWPVVEFRSAESSGSRPANG